MRRLAALAACLLACGGGSDAPDVTPDASDEPPEPTYYADVLPILQDRCHACHLEDGIAGVPLATPEQLDAWADSVVEQVTSRAMPPWPVDSTGACGTYTESRWLSDAELDTLTAWAEGTRLAGDPSDAPEAPTAGPDLAPVHATLDMGASYAPDPDLSDDYRCFLVDPGISEDRFLTAYQVHPGEPRIVHHVILFALGTPEAEAEAQALADQTPALGYPCFGGPSVSSSTPIGGWAPGTDVVHYPAETGVRLHANRKLVVQVHYNLREGPLMDRTTIDLQLAETVAKEGFIYGVADLDLLIEPGLPDATSSYDFDLAALGLPLGIHVRGVFPHMHERGRTLRVDATRDGQSTCLVDVPHWDFDFQQFYFYEQSTYLYADDVLTITCSYDTTEETEALGWGEGTDDEMCLCGLYVTLF